MGSAPRAPARDGSPFNTRICLPCLMRVTEPVEPKHTFPVGPTTQGPLPPLPASAMNRVPFGRNESSRGLFRPRATTARAAPEPAEPPDAVAAGTAASVDAARTTLPAAARTGRRRMGDDRSAMDTTWRLEDGMLPPWALRGGTDHVPFGPSGRDVADQRDIPAPPGLGKVARYGAQQRSTVPGPGPARRRAAGPLRGRRARDLRAGRVRRARRRGLDRAGTCRRALPP